MAVRPTLSPHRSPPTIATPVAIVAPASAVERLESLLVSGGLSVVIHADSPDTLGRIDADPAAVVLMTSDLGGSSSRLGASAPGRRARGSSSAPSASPRALRPLHRARRRPRPRGGRRRLSRTRGPEASAQARFPSRNPSAAPWRGLHSRPARSRCWAWSFWASRTARSLTSSGSRRARSRATWQPPIPSSVRTRAEAAAFILDPRAGLGTGILAITDE